MGEAAPQLNAELTPSLGEFVMTAIISIKREFFCSCSEAKAEPES